MAIELEEIIKNHEHEIAELYKMVNSRAKELAVFSNEVSHLIGTIKDLKNAICKLDDSVNDHSSKFDKLDSAAQVREARWQIFKTQWWKIIGLSVLLGGALAESFEIVRALPHK